MTTILKLQPGSQVRRCRDQKPGRVAEVREGMVPGPMGLGPSHVRQFLVRFDDGEERRHRAFELHLVVPS